MPTYTIRDDRGRTLWHTDHVSCLPDPEALASMYDAGLALYESSRKTTAARRKELMALRANELKGE